MQYVFLTNLIQNSYQYLVCTLYAIVLGERYTTVLYGIIYLTLLGGGYGMSSYILVILHALIGNCTSCV